MVFASLVSVCPGGRWFGGAHFLPAAAGRTYRTNHVAIHDVWASRRDHSGSLKWSEGKWTWSSQTYACSGTLTVLVDVQQVLVVIMKVDDGGVLWFWLRRVADPSAWPALRRAMVSTSGRHALPADRATDGAPL